MTIEEIKSKYGITERGYINCCDCPVLAGGYKEICPTDATGYEDCWRAIQYYMYESTEATKPIEHDGCETCKHTFKGSEDHPCIDCKGTSVPGTEEHRTRPDMFEISEPEVDMVNHPPHYTSSGMECIDELELVFGTGAVKAFCLCNVWKYRKRALLKNGQEDLDKADWYMAKYKELEDKDNEFHNKLP